MDPHRIFNISSSQEFQDLSLEVCRFQYDNNKVYQKFCNLLEVDVSEIMEVEQIPFLPIQFFKQFDVLSSVEPIQKIFTSSGTSGQKTSKHLVTDLCVYERSFIEGFENFYGPIEEFVILALLPSYLERDGSSLIYMAQEFISRSSHPESGFYLHNLTELKNTLLQLEKEEKKILLIGVSFALLNLVEEHQFQLKNTIVMETGGMKGRRKEMIRTELHEILKSGFGASHIHSEYGMTELLSQAYSKGDGIFEFPAWMDIIIRDPEDAKTILPNFKTGGINVIDLANINSCSFIATQDLGKKISENKIEILGRFDNSDIRGCNLMVI